MFSDEYTQTMQNDLETLQEQARIKIKELADELAQEFALQLQQGIQQYTSSILYDENVDSIPRQQSINTYDAGGDGWLANALGTTFNQVLTRLANGKTLHSRTAVTSLLHPLARSIGTQLGNGATASDFMQLRLSESQQSSDIWAGLGRTLSQ